MTAVDAVGEFNDNAVEEQRFVLEIYDNIDGAVCYVLLSGLALYALYTFIRERFFIRKKYTLRVTNFECSSLDLHSCSYCSLLY